MRDGVSSCLGVILIVFLVVQWCNCETIKQGRLSSLMSSSGLVLLVQMSVRDRIVLRERESRKRGSIDVLFRGKRDVFQSSTKEVNQSQMNESIKQTMVYKNPTFALSKKETSNVTIQSHTQRQHEQKRRALFCASTSSRLPSRRLGSGQRCTHALFLPLRTNANGKYKTKIHLVHFIFILKCNGRSGINSKAAPAFQYSLLSKTKPIYDIYSQKMVISRQILTSK